eukprot:CAMPEP_0171378818 /NCGR_PEP_ID=MMETSP0879-20121228/24980_1 /TAXON_ID=67004 /ORGANISM="Thalassiosira weissflogii, Strain CCMP1336" /LENGTH=356 /DNA_ID=CAMNT_0011889383 /DNA_START=196 /DNA_END=1266 /DNA_ORIENTATION=+
MTGAFQSTSSITSTHRTPSMPKSFSLIPTQLFMSVKNNEANDSSQATVISDDTTSNPATIAIANQTFTPPTSTHLQTIQSRQLHHALTPSQVFCTSTHSCRHGHPQAFGFHPTKGPKLVSGLFRLSCPLLVQAIDEWEGEGGVREMSDWMLRNDHFTDRHGGIDGKVREGLTKEEKIAGYEYSNEMQTQIRTELVDSHADFDNGGDSIGARSELERRLGEHNANKFLESGVAGIPPHQTFDVKCIHAHVADHLCRSSGGSMDVDDENESVTRNGNIIGRKALQILQVQRGVPIHGSAVCWQQCDVNRDVQPGDWNYTPKKNRQGLRSTRLRRKERMMNFQSDDDGVENAKLDENSK